jgi:hypothetical protein
MRTVGVLALAIGALALAGGASAARKNPCALVTAANAKAALGGAVGAGAKQVARVFDTCTYAKGRSRLAVKTRAISRTGFDRAARHIPGTSLAVPGIGDVAWVYFVPNGVSLALWKRGTEVVVAVTGAGDGASPIVRQVAQAAAARL